MINDLEMKYKREIQVIDKPGKPLTRSIMSKLIYKS